MTWKAWMVAGFSVWLAGCDYTVPLVTTPEIPIDKALAGVWSRTTGEGGVERLLVLPLGPAEYLVSFPAGEKQAMFARACHARAGDLKLVQLTWFGTAVGTQPEDGRVYQYAVYTLKGDTLQIGLVNADVVKREVATPEALLRALDANREKPDFFREAMVFKKVPPPAAPDAPPARPPLPAGWQ